MIILNYIHKIFHWYKLYVMPELNEKISDSKYHTIFETMTPPNVKPLTSINSILETSSQNAKNGEQQDGRDKDGSKKGSVSSPSQTGNKVAEVECSPERSWTCKAKASHQDPAANARNDQAMKDGIFDESKMMNDKESGRTKPQSAKECTLCGAKRP